MDNFAERLSRTDLTALLSLGRPTYFPAGQPLMREGDRGDCVIIIQRGQVKVTSAAGSGHRRLVGVRGPGELLGEMACLDEKPRSATVIAHSPVQAVTIAGRRFREFLSRNPSVSVLVACQVIGRLRAAERRQGELASHEVAPRLVRMLGELVAIFGGPRMSVIPLSQCEIAELINAAPVSTQRALRLLRQQRVVRTGYGKVIVPCVSCLERLAAVLGSGGKDAMKAITGCGGATGFHSE